MDLPAPPAPPSPPTPADIAVLILTHNGARHLPTCLIACLALDGLAAPSAIVVADNGSTGGGLDDAMRAFPAITRLALGANLGFAAGYDALAESGASDRPWLLLLNDDTAIAPDALTALCAALRPGDVCAGARLVDWAGTRIDFDGGAASWTGHGHALGHGRRIDAGSPRSPAAHRAPVRPAGGRAEGHGDGHGDGDPHGGGYVGPHGDAAAHPTLFACGGAMLVHRATFLALGGFDGSYFMYYEDVDFGWRLTLAGYDVRHAPAAVVRHRGGGSAAAHPDASRARWHARNALANVVKNTADVHVARILPAALALEAVRRGAPLDVVDAAAVPVDDRAAAPSMPLPLPAPDWPGWSHLTPLDLDWPALTAARAAVQPLWARRPEDVVARLGRPWAPVPATGEGWAALRRAAAVFGLEDVFGPIDAHTGLRGRVRRAVGRVGRLGRLGRLGRGG
ncbi:MAG: glycosyltransferase family 2 protein [Ardenticatenales bacterium]